MYDEPYDYYEEEEYKASGDELRLSSFKEADIKIRNALDHLRQYIKHCGVESEEVATMIADNKGLNTEYYINKAIEQVNNGNI